ncbi:MAG: DNA cytosine methyltransferase [Pseudomonadales bacterium]|nr:DNA cytosine methyltransferase [Pseudomonadales bacterium]MCB1673549.1 DNA cytosine methyltransferase [Pseudomonadales bacterium]
MAMKTMQTAQQSSFKPQIGYQADLLDELYGQFTVAQAHECSLTGWTFIDLFAGIGGIRLPFSELGATCVFSSEWDKHAQQTYAANYQHLPAGDITQIEAHEIPPFDMLLAGFPCQPFSNAGLKKGFEDTRGTLFFDICRIIQHHSPKVLLLENVKGFKGHDKGKTFQVVKQALQDLGYSVYDKILNARDFGVPQNRERIFIVAFLNSYFKHEEYFLFPHSSNIKTCVADILETTAIDPKYTLSDRLWQGHQRRKQEHLLKGNGFGYSLFDEQSAYTSTISARYYKDGSEILIAQANNNPRKLTPREAARLQGFPDSFMLPSSDVQAYKQLGNSVAVPVIRAIAKQIALAIQTTQQQVDCI